MQTHLYLSLFPEALIASMLEPADFAAYYAVGTESKTKGQAIFIEVDPAYRHPFLPVEAGLARCRPHADGGPKRSVYISVYRVLEHVPVSAMGRLWLATRDGRALPLERGAAPPAGEESLHLYSELAPTRPTVVSTFAPAAFFDLLTGRSGGFSGLPAVAFAELRLGELATDPEGGGIGDLPYDNVEHLRTCLGNVRRKEVASKIFDRGGSGTFPFRMVKSGVFVGSQAEGLSCYLLPPAAELRRDWHDWWRSAQM